MKQSKDWPVGFAKQAVIFAHTGVRNYLSGTSLKNGFPLAAASDFPYLRLHLSSTPCKQKKAYYRLSGCYACS